MTATLLNSHLIRALGRFARNRVTAYVIVAAVASSGLAYRLMGMGRSLWLDEAWVANSVLANSLAGMFYYEPWLQTSPPLFLLFVRGAVGFLGPSNTSLRIVPLIFGLLSIVVMYVLAHRVLSAGFARLAWAMFVLSPLVITFSKSLKQFSLEAAVTATLLLACVLYLERPTNGRFWLLLGTSAISPLLAYPSAFILPGIVLMVGLVRGLVLASVSGAVFSGVYIWLVLPNSSPALRSYWAQDSAGRGFLSLVLASARNLLGDLPVPAQVLSNSMVASALGAIFLCGFILACLRLRHGRQAPFHIQVICGIPCLLLILCDSLSIYPMNERTGLFLRPAFLLLFVANLQIISHFLLTKWGRGLLTPILDLSLVALPLMLVFVSVIKHPIAAQSVPLEDMASAVSFLKASVRESDLVWVHASCAEAFKLYQRMSGWTSAKVQVGHTGWPCCPRGLATKPVANEAMVRSDINRTAPSNFPGRIWLVYTTRSEHWEYVGMDESRVLNAIFRERGCTQTPTQLFHGVAISTFDCPPPLLH